MHGAAATRCARGSSAKRWYLLQRKRELFPEFRRSEYMRDGQMHDRTVVFSRAVWKFWGSKQMVIPDLATSAEKFIEAVERGNAVCRKYFPHYTLYCVGIKLRPEHKPHYEMSCIPPDAEGWAYGCEFEPMIDGGVYSRDYFQSFKNAIYDIGVDLGAQLLPLRRHDERLYPARVRRRAGGPPPGDEARGRPGDDPQPRRDFLMFSVFKSPFAARRDHADCSGCSLCLLVCPVWRQSRDVSLTPLGFAKAMQHGAGAAGVAAPVEHCTLCMACEPVCPEGIDITGVILSVRRELESRAGCAMRKREHPKCPACRRRRFHPQQCCCPTRRCLRIPAPWRGSSGYWEARAAISVSGRRSGNRTGAGSRGGHFRSSDWTNSCHRCAR